jgi:hypothetical protein
VWRAEAYSQTAGFGTRFAAANTSHAVSSARSGRRGRSKWRHEVAGRNRAAATGTNNLPLVMNYITATTINRGPPTANLRSSVTERGMTNKAENREVSIPAITVGLVLFFSAVALSLGYLASHSGLLTA